MPQKDSAEKAVRDIRRKTRRADPWHPNREGHTVIAEALVGPVLERLH